MSVNQQQTLVGYGFNHGLQKLAPLIIRAYRNPGAQDFGQYGQQWLNQANPAVPRLWVFMGGNVGSALWAELATGGGSAGVFTSLTVTPGPIALTGVTTINTAAGAQNTSIGSGANTGTLNLGWVGNTTTTLAGATVGIDSASGGGIVIGSLVLQTGDILIGNSLSTGDISIGGTGASTGLIDIAPGTGAQVVNIANAAGIKTLNLANGVSGNDINMGNGANTAAQVIDIASGASAADSVVNILAGNGTAGTQTANIMTGTRAGVVNISTGAAAHVTTIGSSTAGNRIVLASPITQLPGPVYVYTGAGAPANGLALHIGDLYIRTDATGPTERMYIATGVGAWTNVTCAA